MSVFLTADWHLGEDRFELMGRPFTTRDEMIDTLIKNHNEIVKPDDHVYMLGDVCYQKTPEFLPRVDDFNGIKTLFRGNHDRVFTDQDLQPYFRYIVAEGDGMRVMFEDVECWLTHYPTQGVDDAFNLVGHIHAAWKYQLNMLNVGVDVHHFRPVNSDTIPFHLNAITTFYDMDVWVAYAEMNECYRETRGKKSRYLDN